MSDPVILRLVRPYDSTDDYLAAEAKTIAARGMLLVGAGPLPKDTIVRFVVSLRSGQALIKAEGRVRAHRAASEGVPGGLEVRFKRFGGATKELVDRAVAYRASAAPPEPDPDSSPHSAQIIDAELSAPDAAPPPEPPARLVEAVATTAALGDSVGEVSGVRHQRIGDIEPPTNRDELLDKLRSRARTMTEAKIASFSKKAQVG